MDIKKTGLYIQNLRKKQGLSQNELANKLNVSFQAVSKWETGENLPEATILLDLADILDTTVDNILNGGTTIKKQYRKISISKVIEGFKYIENIKECFGAKSLFYVGMVEGINQKMNIDIETHLINPREREVLYAEAVIQAVKFDNCYVDIEEIKEYFSNQKLIKYIEDSLEQNKKTS